ncbi:MAG: flavodoxin family protein [Erysipelotrichaceae bacterium]|nr:flavodoxin family protein [Erysipelotrichaceae bacterium]
MKTVLLINGSPNRNGNTSKALSLIEDVFTDNNIATVRFELGNKPVRGCLGCDNCVQSHRCVFKDDNCNDLIEKMLEADGIIIGSPVYFAGANGALCALLDRAFYACANHGQLLKDKCAAAVVTVWREGGSTAIDRLNKYFTFSQMNIISSDYWNVLLNGNDPYGEAVLHKLAVNMSAYLNERN